MMQRNSRIQNKAGSGLQNETRGLYGRPLIDEATNSVVRKELVLFCLRLTSN